MAEMLAVASGAFAVVGLADVVVRASREVCQFLDAIKNAPAEVERLKNAIRDNTLLVEATQQYCRDLTDQDKSPASPPPTDLSQALPQFTSALYDLRRTIACTTSFSVA